MADVYKAVKVTEDVFWVGAVDWAVRDFHGYLTQRGSTYNAFLIMADKITLIDTVKAPFKDELLARIKSVVDPGKIEYLVSNHSEPDHSGAIPQVIDAIKPKKVFASRMGVQALGDYFGLGDLIAVKEGENLSLGNKTLAFIDTPMLHWPDSMMSYLVEENLLFAQDAFGMHLASAERFADEIPFDLLEWEGAKYYANILLPLSGLVIKALDKIAKSGLKIDILAPDHGPIWRNDIGTMPGLYARWAAQKPANKAIIVYDTMWQSTAKMAKAVWEGLVQGGTSAKLLPLSGNHRSDVATEILDAGAVFFGSPTINNNMFPTLGDCLTYLRGLKPKNKIGAAFGSYGWSGEAVEQIQEIMKSMGIELVGEGLKARYAPKPDDLEQCRALGAEVAEKLKGML